MGLLVTHGYEAKVLAGGQSLVPAMNFRLARPGVLVDLGGVPELAYLRREGDEVRIGAMTRQAVVERSPDLAVSAPLLQRALPWIAHPQIRNRGTIGGSLAHADPAAELPAVWLALEGRMKLRGPRGERWVAARDFYVGLFATAIEPDEVLSEVALPLAVPGWGFGVEEMARRHGDYALAGVALAVRLDASNRCDRARVALFSVGEGPVESPSAARVLLGETPTDSVLAAAAAAVRADIEPDSDIHASAAFRRHLAESLTRRALRRAFDEARRSQGGRR